MSASPCAASGLLVTPEEQTKPPVVARANVLADQLTAEAAEESSGLYAIHADPKFRALHLAWLPHGPSRKKGDISSERALAEAKLAEAETIDEALSWLRPKERMAILQDPRANRAPVASAAGEPGGGTRVVSRLNGATPAAQTPMFGFEGLAAEKWKDAHRPTFAPPRSAVMAQQDAVLEARLRVSLVHTLA